MGKECCGNGAAAQNHFHLSTMALIIYTLIAIVSIGLSITLGQSSTGFAVTYTLVGIWAARKFFNVK